MSLLSRFKRTRNAQDVHSGPAHIDVTLGDEHVQRFADALRAGNITEARQLLASAPGQEFRFLNNDLFADEPPVTVSERWVQADPDDGLALLTHANLLAHSAWEARGSGYSDTVTDEGRRLFTERLTAASAYADRAMVTLPASSAPAATVLCIERGLGLAPGNRIEAFNRGVQAGGYDYYLCIQMLRPLAPKWGGSAEALVDFARAVSAALPTPDPAHGIIAEAYAEIAQWIYHGEGWEAMLQFFSATDVKRELADAAHRSIFHAEIEDTPLYQQAANAFALCFYLADESALANRAFQATKGTYSMYPWAFISQPGPFVRQVLTAIDEDLNGPRR